MAEENCISLLITYGGITNSDSVAKHNLMVEITTNGDIVRTELQIICAELKCAHVCNGKLAQISFDRFLGWAQLFSFHCRRFLPGVLFSLCIFETFAGIGPYF